MYKFVRPHLEEGVIIGALSSQGFGTGLVHAVDAVQLMKFFTSLHETSSHLLRCRLAPIATNIP